MAKIFNAPKEIKKPKLFSDNREKEEEQYLLDVKNHLAKLLGSDKGENFGEIINMQYADGYAQYMVITMSPLQLMHVPLGDAWEHPMASKLNTKDVRGMIEADKSFKLRRSVDLKDFTPSKPFDAEEE